MLAPRRVAATLKAARLSPWAAKRSMVGLLRVLLPVHDAIDTRQLLLLLRWVMVAAGVLVLVRRVLPRVRLRLR